MALPHMMYGTPEGVALDQGAAEAVRQRRLRGTAPAFEPRPTPAMQPGGSPEARAFRETLRASTPAAGTAPAAPTAPTTATTGTKPGIIGRATAGLRAAPGAILEADLAPLAKSAAGGVKNFVTGAAGKVALPIGAADAAATAFGTDTDEYAQRTGIDREATHVPQVVKDLGIRALGTAQDLGNTLTFGLADRVGNLVAGNGFTRSAGNQAGDGVTPAAAPATPTIPSIRQPYSNVRNGTYNAPANPVSAPEGSILREGNTYSGKNVKFGADIVNPRNPGVGVSSLDTREGHRQNLLELERNATERAAAPMGGVAGINGRTIVDDLVAKHNASKTPDMPRDMSPRARATLFQQQQQQRAQVEIAAAQTAATRANNRDTVRATLRGQDMDYAEKIDAKRMDMLMRQRERELMASITEGTNDPRVMLQRALRVGVDPAKFISGAQELRASGEAERKHADKVLEAHSGDGKGGISPERLAQNRVAMQQMGGTGMGPTEIDSGLRVLNAYNSDAAREDTLMRRLGVTQPRLRVSELPRLDGYTPEVTGKGADWNPTIGVGKGKLRLNHPSQDPIFLDLDPSTGDLKFMERHMGLKLPPQ